MGSLQFGGRPQRLSADGGDLAGLSFQRHPRDAAVALQRRHDIDEILALSTEPERTKTTEQHETKGRNGMFEDVSRRTFLKGTAATAALAAAGVVRVIFPGGEYDRPALTAWGDVL